MTKGETLALLRGNIQHGAIPGLLYFSVTDWKLRRDAILREIRGLFGEKQLAVRSSARNEDNEDSTLAGHYQTFLNVANQPGLLAEAIDGVAARLSGDAGDQVLVQEMVQHVAFSGVISTRDLNTGAPYYVVEYDDQTPRTDIVTSGGSPIKSIAIHACAPEFFVEPRFVQLLNMARELEKLWPQHALNIEFAQDIFGVLFLLQVRSIPIRKELRVSGFQHVSDALRLLEEEVTRIMQPRCGIAGSRSILGQMPDWNPAELIGAQPSPLAASLFRTLITDCVWQRARFGMGYRAVPRRPLMLLLADRPYIDVRNSFNSFLPAGVPASIQQALVDAWLDRLHDNPDLHDKVEFQVAQTAFDFTFEDVHRARYAGVLSTRSLKSYKNCLRSLTNRNVTLKRTASLAQALERIQALERKQATGPMSRFNHHSSTLKRAFQLMKECRQYGTFPFAIVARHAFIAEAMLRSAVDCGALEEERLADLRRSLTTPGMELKHDFFAVREGKLSRRSFLNRYGHLRPGTFDIASPRYDQRSNLFDTNDHREFSSKADHRGFNFTTEESCSLNKCIASSGLNFRAGELLKYAIVAIAGRELAKFVFSRHLSDALECFALWGESVGLNREDLSFLTLEDFSTALDSTNQSCCAPGLSNLIAARRVYARKMRDLRLGCLIRNIRDLYVVHHQSARPNFVTLKRVEGPTIRLENHSSLSSNVLNKIVCIENADPGFDWIFPMGIAGLITKYGGANSHMAVRCAEMSIPGAIGVGEPLFEHLSRANCVQLFCGERVVRPI